MIFGRDSSIRIHVDSLASKIHANLALKSLISLATRLSMLTFLASLARHGWFELLVLRVKWNKFLVIFLHYRASVLQLPIYASPSAWHSLPFLSRVLATNDLAWMSLAVFSVSSLDHKNPSGGFSLKRVNWEVISCFTGIRIWVLRWWRWRPFWFSKKIFLTFSSNWVVPYQARWMFSVPDLLQQILFAHLRLENVFSIFFGKYYILCIESFRVDFRASIVSNSSRSATNTSPFQILSAYNAYPRNNPGKTFFPNWWILDWSFAVIGWYSTNDRME